MALNRLDIINARQQYKIENAISKLAGRKPATKSELILAELKLVNHLDPQAIVTADRVTNARKSLEFYRKKYNHEGVTKIFNRFTKAKPFVNARKIINLLGASFIVKYLSYLK